jgi:hypothetical protein
VKSCPHEWEKYKISRTDKDYDMESEEGDMNELAYKELILLIYDNSSSGKGAFILVKGCKNKDYVWLGRA